MLILSCSFSCIDRYFILLIFVFTYFSLNNFAFVFMYFSLDIFWAAFIWQDTFQAYSFQQLTAFYSSIGLANTFVQVASENTKSTNANTSGPICLRTQQETSFSNWIVNWCLNEYFSITCVPILFRACFINLLLRLFYCTMFKVYLIPDFSQLPFPPFHWATKWS